MAQDLSIETEKAAPKTKVGEHRMKAGPILGILLVLLVPIAGCGSVTWRDYHGVQDWATGSGFSSETKDGLNIYEGLPERPYEVLGIVEAQGPASFFTQPAHRKRMHELIREHGGDAMIVIGREIIKTGSSGTYSGQAYERDNRAYESGNYSSSDQFNYAMAVLAIRLVGATSQPVEQQGRDPVEWARSVLTDGTAILGSETDR